eukprot:1194921-Prorocentrum_minimum.AAC.2
MPFKAPLQLVKASAWVFARAGSQASLNLGGAAFNHPTGCTRGLCTAPSYLRRDGVELVLEAFFGIFGHVAAIARVVGEIDGCRLMLETNGLKVRYFQGVETHALSTRGQAD